jgi:predicted ATPase
MLTRLHVKGFKNLADVHVAFGPFTCVAGANGVGKSNLFDAITFLSAIADRPLIDAARCVRDEKNRSNEVKSLFFRAGNETVDEITFIADMLVPAEGVDELGQTASASITFLQYTLVLGYETDAELQQTERLVVRREELQHNNVGDARKRLAFEHSPKWRKSVVHGRRSSPFISTVFEQGNTIVKLHQEGGMGGGRTRRLLASKLPRTVLSSTNAAESPTALLAKREMQSWRLLQLEPTALRNPDPFNAPTHIGADGSHLAATLHHLARTRANGNGGDEDSVALRTKVANRLSELVEDIQSVDVDVDNRRELLTLQITDRGQTLHPARALSDGTLRFLALSILELDTSAHGLLCFEEPENGIHPERIPSMLRLLEDLATDPEEKIGQDNPLRQVIVNTHSPAVVGLVDDADLLVAEPCEVAVKGHHCRAVTFSWLEDTWRQTASPNNRPLSRGKLRFYLNPLAAVENVEDESGETVTRSHDKNTQRKPRRVKDRSDLQLLLPHVSWSKDE